MQSQKPKYEIDGRAVYGYLFAHIIVMPNGRRIPHMFQVDGFSKDHAWQRLKEWKPHIRPSEIEFLDYLEPEHDVGYLGEKLPLYPVVANQGKYWAH